MNNSTITNKKAIHPSNNNNIKDTEYPTPSSRMKHFTYNVYNYTETNNNHYNHFNNLRKSNMSFHFRNFAFAMNKRSVSYKNASGRKIKEKEVEKKQDDEKEKELEKEKEKEKKKEKEKTTTEMENHKKIKREDSSPFFASSSSSSHPYSYFSHQPHHYYECNNCGKYGHSFNHCKMPIISFGLIVVRFDRQLLQYEYLMIRRKDSYGYIDFIRGKYMPQNVRQLTQIIRQMSQAEKERILKEPFPVLWRQMCGGGNDQGEETLAERKYNRIRKGVLQENEMVSLDTLLLRNQTDWKETEWEFPKGRRNSNETELECGLREFEEETGIPKRHVRIMENILPFEETFIGTNYKSYKHKYFLAWLPDEEENEEEKETEKEKEEEKKENKENKENNHKMYPSSRFKNFQKSEVSKVEWKSFDECVASIRPYNLEKRNLVCTIHHLFNQYRFFLF